MHPRPTDLDGWVRQVNRDVALLKRQGAGAAVVRLQEQVKDIRDDVAGGALIPTAPIEVVGQTSLYVTQRRQRGRADIQHPPVTRATNGDDITVDSYELWFRPLGEEEDPWALADRSSVPRLSALDLIPGATYEFRTRAIGSYATPGAWSSPLELTIQEDTDPPRVPTTPTATNSLGVVILTWDGTFSSGTQGPDADLAWVRIEVSTDGQTFTDTNQHLGGAASIPFSGYPLDEPVFFRLVAVDSSGNESPPSTVVSAIPQGIVDDDLTRTTISEKIEENRQKAQSALDNSLGAQGAAEAAQTAADTAQSAAEAAEQAALDAAGIAQGKGGIIYQASAPTGARATSQNLWVRKPDMKVHVYDEDQSKWVPATDPDLVQAAQDATAAKTAAQNAQSAAENAVAESEAAKRAAQQARDAADQAESDAATAVAQVGQAYQAAQDAEDAANAAQSTVAAAEAAADNAASAAADALAQATAAGGDATAAQAAATAAQAAANEAERQAGIAGTSAAQADADAAQAKADAAQAAADAAAAEQEARDAEAAATAARSDADAAAQNAADAYTRAEAAESSATAASGAAGQAEQRADAAAQAAADALTRAQNAEGSVTDAQQAAIDAQAAADVAKAEAQAAGTAAAQADADAAQAAADAAQAAANALAAEQSASSASSRADQAEEDAQTAVAEAQAAAQRAQEAEDSAAAAQGAAGVAEQRADDAAAEALAALQQAQAAGGNAADAQAAADAAQAAATTAQTQAEAAGTSAAAADAAAAQAAADAAQAVADAAAAKTAANEAVTESGLARGEAQDAQGVADSARQTAEGAQSAAAAAQAEANAARDRLNALRVGSRNLLRDSAELTLDGANAPGITRRIDEDGHLEVTGPGSYISNFGLLPSRDHVNAELSAGDQVTFSVEIKAPTPDLPPTIYFSSGAGTGYTRMGPGEVGNDFRRFSATVVWRDDATWNPHMGFGELEGPYTFRRAKLEKGNVATDWTPAPEDVEAEVAAAQARADAAQAKADKAEQDAANAAQAAANAHAAAGNAQDTANAALDSANGKTAILHDNNPPSGTGKPGDIWWQHATDGTGTVIGQWRWIIGLDPFEVAGNFGSKLLVTPLGDGRVLFTPVDAVGLKTWTVGGQTRPAGRTLTETFTTTGTFTVTHGDGSFNVRTFSIPIHPSMLLSAESIGSWVREDIASEAIANLDVGKLTAGSGTFVNLEVANVLRTNILTVGSIDDPTIIADGVVTTRSIVVEEDLWAELGQFVKIKSGMIETDAVLATHIKAGAIEFEHLSGNAIDGKLITGAVFQTRATYPRVVLDSNGLRAHVNYFDTKFSLDAATGNVDIKDATISAGSIIGATVDITGRFTTSSGVNSVVIDSTIYNGRPGVRFDTGSTIYDLQPAIYSMGSGSAGYPAGALILHGRERNLNSTGRAELVLEDGGDFHLMQQYGTYRGTGIHKNGRDLDIQGRSPNGHVTQTISGLGSPGTINSALAWAVSYPAPVPVGTRHATASACTDDTGGFRSAQVGVHNMTASGFRCVIRPNSGDTGLWRYSYHATWV